jgi:hypothetical protein
MTAKRQPREGRQAKAERLFLEAINIEDAARTAEKLRLMQASAELGHHTAQVSLATILEEDVSPPRTAEARRWYRRAARAGNHSGAWNLAMSYRIEGNRRGYFRWSRKAAELGDEDAQRIWRLIEAIRARGRRAPMLFLADFDEDWLVNDLWAVVDGTMDRVRLEAWAGLVHRGEALAGPLPSRRAAEVIEELAHDGRRLSKRRARELLFKLA